MDDVDAFGDSSPRRRRREFRRVDYVAERRAPHTPPRPPTSMSARRDVDARHASTSEKVRHAMPRESAPRRAAPRARTVD